MENVAFLVGFSAFGSQVVFLSPAQRGKWVNFSAICKNWGAGENSVFLHGKCADFGNHQESMPLVPRGGSGLESGRLLSEHQY